MSSGKDVSNNDNNNNGHSSPVHTTPGDNNAPPLPARPVSVAPLVQTLSSDKDKNKDDDRVQQDKGDSLPAAAINHPELGSAGVGPADKVHT